MSGQVAVGLVFLALFGCLVMFCLLAIRNRLDDLPDEPVALAADMDPIHSVEEMRRASATIAAQSVLIKQAVERVQKLQDEVAARDERVDALLEELARVRHDHALTSATAWRADIDAETQRLIPRHR